MFQPLSLPPTERYYVDTILFVNRSDAFARLRMFENRVQGAEESIATEGRRNYGKMEETA
jgi:hypothetical protein